MCDLLHINNFKYNGIYSKELKPVNLRGCNDRSICEFNIQGFGS